MNFDIAAILKIVQLAEAGIPSILAFIAQISNALKGSSDPQAQAFAAQLDQHAQALGEAVVSDPNE